MVSEREAIERASRFVEHDLGYALEFLSAQCVDAELIRKLLRSESLRASESEQRMIANQRNEYWAISFAVKLPDGTQVDPPAVVKVADDGSHVGWMHDTISVKPSSGIVAPDLPISQPTIQQ